MSADDGRVVRSEDGRAGSRAPVRVVSGAERGFLWHTLGGTAAGLARIIVRARVRHRELLPKSGPVIIAPNHYTDFDVIVVGLTIWKLGRAPRFFAKASLFQVPVLGWMFRRVGLIPVERGGATAARALQAARAEVEAGRLVVMYPEGSLTRDPENWPMRGKTGAVRLALQSGAQLVPMATWGALRILPRWSHRVKLWPPRQGVDVIFGEPFDLSPWRGKPMTSEVLQQATDALMQRITELTAELRPGETPPVERWDPSEHGQTEFGRPGAAGHPDVRPEGPGA